MPAKKTPAQLQRDIDEALARRHTQAHESWLSLQAGPHHRERQAAYDEMAAASRAIEAARGPKRAHATKHTSGFAFDSAREAWDDDPSAQTAERYRRVARAYHRDERISNSTLEAILAETAAYVSQKKAHSIRSHATMKADVGPQILKISRGKTFAGQRSITADVQYPGEAPSRVEFVGPSSGGGGPVVMVTSGRQTFVRDPARFGVFGQDWIRRFFEAA